VLAPSVLADRDETIPERFADLVLFGDLILAVLASGAKAKSMNLAGVPLISDTRQRRKAFAGSVFSWPLPCARLQVPLAVMADTLQTPRV
jgi:hypothetical protein